MSGRIIQRGFVSEFGRESQPSETDRIYYAVTGHFIAERDPQTKKIKPESVKLFDDNTRIYHDMKNVSFLWRVSSPLEGEKKFPRPFVYERGKADDEVPTKLVRVGEKLKLTYMGGSIYNVLVEGAIEAIEIPNQVETLFLDAQNLDRQIKRYETDNYVLEAENNGAGEVTYKLTGKADGTGNVTLEITGTNGNGKLALAINGVVTISQKDADGNVIQTFTLDNTKDSERIALQDKHGNQIETSSDGVKVTAQKDKKTNHLVYGETVVEKLSKLIDKIAAMTFTNGGGITSVANNVADITAIKSELNEILTA